MQIKILLAGLLAATGAAAQDWPAGEDDVAARIHERVLTLDTHVDIPLDYATAAVDPGALTSGQVDLPKMRAGGLDAAFFIVYTGQGEISPEGFAEARRTAHEKLDAIRRMVAAYPDEIGLALSSADARRIAKSGRKVAFIGMENPYPLGASVHDVAAWGAAGVRYLGLTHFGHNQFGDSANPDLERGDKPERHGGLSKLGRTLVTALNRQGVMVDVSHAGRKTMMQATELSAAPVIASHSATQALADSPRNLDDEQLRAIAENGGVAQIVALDVYVKPLTEAQKAAQENIRKEMNIETSQAREEMDAAAVAEYERRLDAEMWSIEPRASVADFVDHIDHAVEIAGVDHVGIASDFDGGGGIEGWQDASETLNVTRELVKRGYSEKDIAKLWSGNLLRVLDEVQETAKRMR